jgi:glycosyltransferase involved in cell wall biosynthesis
VRVLRILPQRVSRERIDRLRHTATYFLTDALLLAKLSRLVQEYAVDLVQFHSRFRSPLTHLALRQSGVPVLADLRDRMIAPRRLAFCDGVLCCAEGLRLFAEQGGLPAHRLFYVPNPLPLFEKPTQADIQSALARHRMAADQPYLLYVGDITRNKGVYELLQGYAAHLREIPDAPRLILAGSNREGARFTRRLRETTGARYLGPLPRAEVLALMQQAAAVLLPSRSEGLPTVILEALSLQRRVMCPPNVIEFERACPDWVLSEVSAEAIRAFLIRMRVRPEAPAFSLDAFRWPRVVDQLIEVFTSLIVSRSRHEPLRP